VATLTNAPKTRSTNGRELTRCRLRTACDGTVDGLELRPIRDGCAVRPTMCCAACADGRLAR
jgi:hypothetical protein